MFRFKLNLGVVLVLFSLSVERICLSETVGGHAGGGVAPGAVNPAACLATVPEFSFPYNAKTGEALLPMPFSTILHSLPVTSFTNPAGNGVTNAVTDIVLDTTKMVLTYLSPCRSVQFVASATTGVFFPTLPGLYRQLNMNSDGSFVLYPLGGGTGDYLRFNSSGRLTQVVKENVIFWQITYDSSNLLKQLSDGNGNTRSYTYGSNGQVATVTQAQKVFTYSYDSQKNLTSISGPGGTFFTATYLSNSQPNLVTWADMGMSLSLSYNSDGTLSSYSGSGDTTVTTLSYSSGFVSTVNSPTGVTQYTFDSHGRTLSISRPDGTASNYSYWDVPSTNFFSDVIAMDTETTNPNGCTVTSTKTFSKFNYFGQAGAVALGTAAYGTYAYNVFGKLTSATVVGQPPLAINYDSQGRKASLTSGSQTTYYAYDPNGFLSQQTFQGRSTTIAYSNDALGRLLQSTDDSGTHTFAYLTSGPDGFLGKLTNETLPSGTARTTIVTPSATSSTSISVTETPIGGGTAMTVVHTYDSNWVPRRKEEDPLYLFPAGFAKLNYNQAATADHPNITGVCN